MGTTSVAPAQVAVNQGSAWMQKNSDMVMWAIGFIIVVALLWMISPYGQKGGK